MRDHPPLLCDRAKRRAPVKTLHLTGHETLLQSAIHQILSINAATNYIKGLASTMFTSK